MRNAFANFARISGFFVIAASFTVGCAGDKDTLDLVQPGYIAKEDLLGKSWYYRRTVVDSPETMYPYAGVGAGDLFTVERVKFEIQENHIIAFRDYEYIENTEGLNDPGGAEGHLGTPVASWQIASHFDIIHDYNPATGEKTNVRREDSMEQAWFDREFIRVNWNNAKYVSDYFILPVDYLDTDGHGGSDDYVHPDDASNPYHARLTPEKGYLDVVLNHAVVPDIAVCYYDFDFSIYELTSACASGEIRVRHAFWEVDEEQNAHYETLNFPDSVVLTDDAGNEISDPLTGESKREEVFGRFGYYRLDRKSHEQQRGITESGLLQNIIRFNIWDKSLDSQGNSIPYADRTVRPIVYHTNWDFPADLWGTAQEVAEEWNVNFKETVASLKGVAISDVPDVFVLKENNCNRANLQSYLSANKLEGKVADTVGMPLDEGTLDNWCSATEYLTQDAKTPFTWAQMGDSRYNMMYWVNHVVPSGWSGYGPMLGDPVNGRNVTSTAYIMGWTVESSATRALEYIDYMNGELDLSDILAGTDVPNQFYSGDYDPQAHTYDINEVQQRAAREPSEAYMDDLKSRFAAQGETWDESMTEVENSSYFADRLARVAGTDLERDFLIRSEDLMLASRGEWSPGNPVSDELFEQASYVNRMRERSVKQQHTQRFLQERTMCPMADLDNALIGLAKSLKDLSRDERRNKLRQYIFKAVMLHEVGHNVGLRHNFEASYDALNYDREFWNIEAAEGNDAEAKLDRSQPEYMYSSIMDYHGKINGDFHGLGLYDKAAIKFGYGQLIERFESTASFADPTIGGGDSLRDWTFFNDYKKLPAQLNGTNGMYTRTDVKWDWTQPQVESATEGLLANEVPYMFCSDDYANRTPTCKRFDFGANQREVQQASYVRYKNYFIFSNFLRNRLVLDFGRTINRSNAVFADTLLTYQYMYLYQNKYEDFLDSDLGTDMAQAVKDGLNGMSEVISMPRPNNYYRCVLNEGAANQEITYYTGGWVRTDAITDPTTGIGPDGDVCDVSRPVEVGIGEGYPLFLGFSEEYINYTFTYLGTYWDKLNALYWMNMPLARYYRENQAEDNRSYSVGFYRIYNQEVNDVLLGLIEYDRKSVASGFDEVNGHVMPREMVVDPGTGQPQAKIVPALARNLQYYSLMYGMAFLTSPFDDTLDFAKHARVVVKGAPDDFFDEAGFIEADPVLGCAPGARCYTECSMPEAGIVYRAHNTTAESSRIDVAYNFVNRCREDTASRSEHMLASEALDLMVASLSGDLETLEGELSGLTTGTQAYDDKLAEVEAKETEVDTKTEEALEEFREYEAADSRLRQTEQVLMFTRSLNRVYEYGAGL